jgi:hypothetical protein
LPLCAHTASTRAQGSPNTQRRRLCPPELRPIRHHRRFATPAHLLRLQARPALLRVVRNLPAHLFFP